VTTSAVDAPLSLRAQLRWEYVRPYVTAVSPRSTIEVGTGQGAMGARLAALTAGPYVGFELDRRSFERAAEVVGRAGGTVHHALLEDVDPEPADLLCSFEVLEHLEDDRDALGSWVRYVRPGGHVLLSVPAHQRRFGPSDELVGHHRRYEPDGLAALARDVGLDAVTVRTYGAPLGYALEAVRNRIDARRLDEVRRSGLSAAERTATSGRQFQFGGRSWRSTAATAATLPFAKVQRIWPGGIGLLLTARAPGP
jgi:SAM-dependent methyltransferase